MTRPACMAMYSSSAYSFAVSTISRAARVTRRERVSMRRSSISITGICFAPPRRVSAASRGTRSASSSTRSTRIAANVIHRPFIFLPLHVMTMRKFALVALFATACIHIAPHPIAPAETAAAFDRRTLDAAQTWDLHRLTDVALRFHPNLDLARAHAAVIRAAIVTAAERPNPTVNANIEHKAEPHTNPWITTLGFDLPIETANKRGLRVRAANDAAR